MTIGDGKIVMANPDEKGQSELVADVEGQGKVRVDGQYLAQALKACGGMVAFNLTNGYSPMLFTSNGYRLVVMPMMTNEVKAEAQAEREAEPTGEVVEPVEPVTEAEQEPAKPEESQ